ncbi:hypothetical protein DESUT3_27750 [Desulfuromonas versatilis]|uniref:histidine kinase n=1 Tax=Desulfuromonas versatilis TaxID=2802975 RepID=A0ABM8HYU2_9BACT|nr:PAS domain S-box protein [Desulfuromonas versatilis]BCR05706.1 hypothetical protein DESUT3_27750 [Desulfuromonas versatilis]
MGDRSATSYEQWRRVGGAAGLFSGTWYGPAFLTLVFLGLLGSLLWLVSSREFEERQDSLHRNLAAAQKAIRLRLDAIRDFLDLLVVEMNEGRLSEENFRNRVSLFAGGNPELINVTFADRDFVIRWTAPYEPNKQVIGLSLSLPEPKRASRLARELKYPVYTRPFVVLQGLTAIEVYLPVYREGEFLGTFGGVMSLSGLLRRTLTPDLTLSYRACFTDMLGTPVGDCEARRDIDPRLSLAAPLHPSIGGLYLQLVQYRSGWGWGLKLLAFLSAGLALGMGGGMWALVRDIRLRRKAEAELSRNYNLLHAILEGTEDAVYAKDPAGRYQMINSAGARILGRPVESILGRTDEDLLPADVAAELKANDRRVLAGHKVEAFDELVPIDGSLRTYLTTKSAFRDGSGRLAGLVGVSRDITSRKQAEDELRESEEKYRLLFSSESDAIIIFDARTRNVVEANDAAARLYHWSPEEMVRLNVNDLTAEPETSRERIEEILAGRLRHIPLALHRKKDGGPFPVEIAAGTFRWKNRPMFAVILRDITERQKLSQMKDEMLSAVSHEMRTPLTAVLGFTEFLLEHEVPAEQRREYLEIMAKEGNRLKELIDNLLSLQRLRAGFGVAHYEPVPVLPLLHELAELFAPQSKIHRFGIDCPPELPPLPADPDKVRRALENLVSNAIKYSPQGGEVTLGARLEDHALVLWVRDQGQGIPAEMQERIFDRFFRVDNTDLRKVGGSGLGLPLVKEIAKAHGGGVGVTSRPGEGSTFFISFPLREICWFDEEATE